LTVIAPYQRIILFYFILLHLLWEYLSLARVYLSLARDIFPDELNKLVDQTGSKFKPSGRFGQRNRTTATLRTMPEGEITATIGVFQVVTV
jgi:hypothetical protein